MRLATCSVRKNAAFRSDEPHRTGGRYFYALAILFLFPATLRAADAWDLVVSVDGSGAVTVDSQRAVQDGSPLPPPQGMREGFTYVELTDAAGHVTDRRSLPLAPEVFYDHAPGDGRLEGGALPAPRLQYNIRLPRHASGQRLRFYRVRRRTAVRRDVSAAASSVPSDFDLDPLGAAVLTGAP